MYDFTLYLLSLFCLVLSGIGTAQNSAPYVPTDSILLNCGESSITKSPDGRQWVGDDKSKFTVSNSGNFSFVSRAPHQDQSVSEIPYITARIIRSKFTYTLPVSPGPKFLRLYFYPVSYSGLDTTTSYFSVSANSYTLLNNFSAYLTVSAIVPPVVSFVKEFVITVTNEQVLSVSFNPSPSSYAFINGIEVVSMPDNLYTGNNNTPITFVNDRDKNFYFDRSTVLETAYRLDVGGPHVSGVEDTGMFREWRNDLDYIDNLTLGTTPFLPNATIKYTKQTPPYVAPVIVYKTSRTLYPNSKVNKNLNLTWIFSVDPGFSYLVRLHFCETLMEITHENQRVFSIFINNQTADEDADIIHWTGGSGIPIYMDYVVWVPNLNKSKQEFWLALHPMLDLDPLPQYANVILNGLEIFKLNNSDGNLAGRNPEPEREAEPLEPQSKLTEQTKKKAWLLVVIVIAALLGCVSALSLLFFIVLRRKKKVVKDSDSATTKKTGNTSWGPISCTITSINTNASSLPSDICRRFSFSEIKEATSNFDDQYIIGTGGFGHVYKGHLDNESTVVAFKRLNSSSNQGVREFHTEIEMISKVRHRHIVSLIGYCDDHGEMILVYEYMSRGNLRDHLYKTKKPPLPWRRRLEICIDAARGLHYLHTGAKDMIIHRDIKSTNILLDENWVAKISDFGLSRTGPTGISRTHISTVVKGSFGYVDPEYFRRQQLTEKSDVYSFGVVLLEVLCARPAIINGVQKEEVSLVTWVRVCQARGALDQIVDPYLWGEIEPVCLTKFVEIAETCVRDDGIQRPRMNDVVWGLEFALQLQHQETTEKNGKSQIEMNEASPLVTRGEVTTTDDDDPFSGSTGHVSGSRSTISSGGKSIIQNDGNRIRSETVFSEIMSPKGR